VEAAELVCLRGARPFVADMNLSGLAGRSGAFRRCIYEDRETFLKRMLSMGHAVTHEYLGDR